LTEAFGGEEESSLPLSGGFPQPEPQAKSEPEPEPESLATPDPEDRPTPSNPLADALGELAKFVSLALAGDGAGQRAFAARARKMPDAIADAINTVTAEVEIYDMILEEDGGVYRVIEDYRDQVQALLCAEQEN
jgi:hypothetical protein